MVKMEELKSQIEKAEEEFQFDGMDAGRHRHLDGVYLLAYDLCGRGVQCLQHHELWR